MSHKASVSTLAEIATPGLHEEVYSHLQSILEFPEGPVLDLGAGTGAWSDRLLQHGWKPVEALDQNPMQFRGNARFVQGDLDKDFPMLFEFAKFRLITALEVIEHLENTAEFLRRCKVLMAKEGVLLLTTPNIESMPGRIKFLLQGRLRHFDSQGDPTHISPIHTFLLKRLAKRAGLSVIETRSIVRRWHDGRWLFRFASSVLAPLVSGAPYGACNLHVLRHRE